MKNKINLGDTVQDKYSGFKGIATAKLIFINGCEQYEITAKTKENKSPEPVFIDGQSLKVIKRKNEEKEESSGGPNTKLYKGGSYSRRC